MLPLVVLPTYNESENIESVIRRIRVALPEACVLVVDDSSPDGTAFIGERLGKELGQVEVMRRPAKAGLGSAYRAGFAWGLERGFEAFVEMDCDLSHEPEALRSLVAPLGEGVDLVVGSRYMPGGAIPNWRLHRRLLSQGGNIYTSLMLGLHVTDSTSGFRAYSADILRRVDLGAVRADGYGFQIEMVHQVLEHGGTVTEVPIRFVDRVEGKSKMSGHIVVEALALVTWWAFLRAARALLGVLRPATTAAAGARPARRTRAAGRLSPASARKPMESVPLVPFATSETPATVATSATVGTVGTVDAATTALTTGESSARQGSVRQGSAGQEKASEQEDEGESGDG